MFCLQLEIKKKLENAFDIFMLDQRLEVLCNRTSQSADFWSLIAVILNVEKSARNITRLHMTLLMTDIYLTFWRPKEEPKEKRSFNSAGNVYIYYLREQVSCNRDQEPLLGSGTWTFNLEASWLTLNKFQA